MEATATGIQSLMYRGKMPYWTLRWSTGLVTWHRYDNIDNIDNVSYDKDSTSGNVLYYILCIEIDWIWIWSWIYICQAIWSRNSDNLSFPKSLCTSLFYFLQFGLWCWLDLLDVSTCFRIISRMGRLGLMIYTYHHIPAPSKGWCLNPKGLFSGTPYHLFGTPWRVQLQVWVKVIILIIPPKNGTPRQPFVKGKPLERIALMRAKCSQWLMKVGKDEGKDEGLSSQLDFEFKT